VANAWMQHPVGFVLRGGRAELASFGAVVSQRFAILEFVHTVGGAYTLAGMFVLGISAWHLGRGQEVAFFKKSFRLAAVWTLVFALFEIGQGHMNAEILQSAQPAKLAAMEAHWETGRNVPIHLLAWPDPAGERNSVEGLSVPGALSLMAGYATDTEVKGLKDFPADQRPPVLPLFLSFRLMVGLGILFLLVSLYAFLKRDSIEAQPRLLKLLPWMIPLPYLANQLGWTLSELGRQPWIVYGIMRTRDAVSPIALVQVATSLIAFFLVYALLGAADFYLLCKFARKGPDPLKAR